MQMKPQKSVRRQETIGPRHKYKSIGKNPREIKATPLNRASKRPLRKIYKCSEFDSEDLGGLDTLLPRFGPSYYANDSMEGAKEDAWQQVLRNSPAEEKEETEDTYLSAIRRVEKTARATYADEVLDGLSDSRFRWMMIKGGCFFLQLALFILEASEQLGYPDDHITFGTKQDKNKVSQVWIKSMFYVGNQIPLVVLNELMKQTFFQDVIREHEKWDRPKDFLSKEVLFDLLIPPAIEYANRKTSSTLLKVPARSTYWSEEQPSDLLHGLQILVLGPQGSRNDSNENDEEDEEEGDLEAGGASNNEGFSNDKELRVSGLGKRGIYFWKSNGIRTRGIKLKGRVLYARLYLPTIPVNRETEMLFKNLKYYEIHQQKSEVRSYLGFMNRLISTNEDVHALASEGIIEASKPYYKERFLRMLKNLKETDTNRDHRHVMQQMRDYSSFPWEKFKYVAIIAFILTIAQTVFGVLSYVVAVAQLNQSHS